jgi:hypothetical protein
VPSDRLDDQPDDQAPPRTTLNSSRISTVPDVGTSSSTGAVAHWDAIAETLVAVWDTWLRKRGEQRQPENLPEDAVVGDQRDAKPQRCRRDPAIRLVHALAQRMAAPGAIAQLGHVTNEMKTARPTSNGW